MANQKPLVISSLGRIQRLQPEDLVDPITLGTGTPGSTTYLRGDGTWATALSTNTASSLVLRDASGNFSAGTITATAIVINGASTNTATVTTTSTAQTVLTTFDLVTYGSAKFLIQATQGTLRHLTELLVVHDGTTASATEYGTILTGSPLFSVNVDILTGSVRILVTSASATSTVYKASFTMIGA